MMRQKKSYTLIELLVAITVIGILSAIAFVSYANRKKKAEYNTAVAQVQAVAAAEKNYILGQGVYVSTTNTSNTNTVLGIKLSDGYFQNYRVNRIIGPPERFNITVFSGTVANNATYTFNTKGDRIACSGSDCLP